jgi:16S rRNA (adenine1518-N6/adenine1519-N6)-dimethyltransferase
VPAIADLLTPTEIRRLLREHGLAPRRTAGQNFVIDPNTVRRIVAAAHLAADDVVLEIGPGLGSLTLALAEVAAEVVAVEIDHGLATALRDVVAAHVNVEVVHADALRSDLGAVLHGREARLVANLPYNVATPLVFHALACPQVDDAFVMVQREVGERWAARRRRRLRPVSASSSQLLAHVEVAIDDPADRVPPGAERRQRDGATHPPCPTPGPGDVRHASRARSTPRSGRRRKTLRNTLRRRRRGATAGRVRQPPPGSTSVHGRRR